MLSELVVTQAEIVIKNNSELVARLVSQRKGFEGWLQLEIFKALMYSHPLIEVEKPLNDGRERCDFWLKEDEGAESWLELKLCVTNYCQDYTRSGSVRPITQQIDGIIRDTARLKQVPAGDLKSVLLVAYPLPVVQKDAPAWKDHLAKLESTVASLTREFGVTLKRNSNSVIVAGYLLAI